MSRAQAHSLGTRTVRGMLWAFGSYAGGRLLVLLTTAILARLLSPADFGLVALALTFTVLLDSLSTFGLGEALVIQEDEGLYDRANTAFVWSVGFGLATSLAVAACSPLIASFFDQPQLIGIVSALGASFFLRSLGITHYALSQRSLDFRTRTIAEFSSVVSRGITGIAFALAGFGAWSLVLGYLVGSAVMTLALWKLVPFRPKLRSRRDHVSQLLRFGGTLSAVGLLAAIGNNIDNMFVGRVLGATALGFYSIAFLVPNLAVVNISVIAQQVLFPAFTAHDRDDLSRAFKIAFRYLWLLTLPVVLILIVLAEPIVLVVFGEKWRAAAEPMRILAIYGFALATSFAAGTVYMATAKAGVLLWLILGRLAILIGGLILFASLGITAVAICQAVAVAIMEAGGVWLACHRLNVRWRDLWAQVWACLVAGLAMTPVLVGVEWSVSNPWVAVIVGALASVGIYVAVLLAIAPDAIHYILSKLRPGSQAAPLPEEIVSEESRVLAG